MNYKQAAKDIREAMRPIRKDAGKWLIADMKKAWDRGDMKYVIHPGTYAISEPIPVPSGSVVDGENKVVILAPCLNYFIQYPQVPQKSWDDPDVWNMGENAFQQA
jgi:hypothetical protein